MAITIRKEVVNKAMILARIKNFPQTRGRGRVLSNGALPSDLCFVPRRTELTAYQRNPDFEIRSHNTPILQLSRKQLLDLSRSVVSAPSGLLSFASVSRSVQCQFTPASRLQSLFDPPPPSPTTPAPTTCLLRMVMVRLRKVRKEKKS